MIAECTGAIDRATDDTVALFLGHRTRFAGEHAFVYRAFAAHHLTVYRQSLTGTHQHQIAAAHVFNGNVGFDIVATSAEETKNPQRDVPRGILGSLAICTVLYMAVSFVVTGMLKYSDERMNTAAPLAEAFNANGAGWASKIISTGAVAGLTTVVLVLMLGQARVLFAMSRDGLLPVGLAKVHPRFGTPYRITILTGVFVAALAGVVPLAELSKLVSIGTLFAFVLVSAGVIILRRTRGDLHRPFRVPAVPWVPGLAILSCGWLMVNLSIETWIRFAVWMVLGFVVYFAYGYRNSRLGRGLDQAKLDEAAPTNE